METKPRILYLKKILEERTDEEHPLSTTQLINILNDEYGISAHRTTVTKDIAALQEFGMDIVTIHSTQSKYFVASRKFELPELKLLIDAVESSKFITKKKSKTLIEKIHTMTSPGQVAKLKRNNYVVNRIKPDNEQIYYIIDAINDAINTGKQISFQYYDYTGLKKKVLKNKGEVYKLSPYKLLWCGDYYYVLGYSEKKSKVINFRVDRMELTENMEEFLNDLIGKRMEQVYQENDGEQYDPFNEELELKVQKVIRKLPQKQRKVIFDYMTETSNNNSDLNEFYYRMGLRDGLKLKETIKTILDTLME